MTSPSTETKPTTKPMAVIRDIVYLTPAQWDALMPHLSGTHKRLLDEAAGADRRIPRPLFRPHVYYPIGGCSARLIAAIRAAHEQAEEASCH